ncbi:metallophosphoesterase [Myxococcota bacterium]|nr:metallophosphoesterase [Myxococcota bacterium]
MSSACTWLHLSDLHAGAPGKGRDWPVVRDAFGRDLDRMRDRLGTPDVVLFTGDLANRGTEYDEVVALLTWLRGRLGPVPVVAVPGNHDLVRPRGGRWSFLYSEDPAARADREAALQDGSLAPLFQPWSAFAGHLRAPDQAGLLPGDASHSLDLGGFKLGLLGLNSAWRQVGGGDHRGHVEVAPAQVHALLPDGADAFREAHHLVLLLQHHPPDWMADPARWRSHVGTAAHAALFGHTHDNEAIVRRAESDEPLVLVQARSLCGLDHYGEAREERRFGYRWGRAQVVDGGVDGPVTRVQTWSRTLVEGDRWRFVHPERAGYDEARGMRLVDVPVPSALRAPAPSAPSAPSAMPAPAPVPGAPPMVVARSAPSVFLCYSRQDATACQALRTRLEPFRANGVIRTFVDAAIPEGDHWPDAIQAALDDAAVGVLLVSPDWLASPFIRRVEAPRLFTRHARGELTLHVAIVRPTNLDPDGLPQVDGRPIPLAELQWTARDGERSIAELSPADQDRAWNRVAQVVKRSAKARPAVDRALALLGDRDAAALRRIAEAVAPEGTDFTSSSDPRQAVRIHLERLIDLPDGVERIERYLAGLAAAVPGAAEVGPGVDPELSDLQRFEVLCGLLPDQLDTLLLRAEVALAVLPPRGQPPAERGHAVVRWLSSQTRATRLAFDQRLRAMAPGAFE